MNGHYYYTVPFIWKFLLHIFTGILQRSFTNIIPSFLYQFRCYFIFSTCFVITKQLDCFHFFNTTQLVFDLLDVVVGWSLIFLYNSRIDYFVFFLSFVEQGVLFWITGNYTTIIPIFVKAPIVNVNQFLYLFSQNRAILFSGEHQCPYYICVVHLII